jgi:uncharacterized protein
MNKSMNSGKRRPFRILSLDGGGIRGAFTAAFAAEVEKHLGVPLADHFDLIAGTSTGAIIAVALAFREPANKIEHFYRHSGPDIFKRRTPARVSKWKRPFIWAVDNFLRRKGVDYDGLVQSKHEAAKLQEALEEVFGNRTLGDCSTRLVIPSVDLTRGQTAVFKTPHMPTLFRDRTVRVLDALLSTTAAPTYFPHAVVQTGSAYIDGGVWANNPSMVAYAETLKVCESCNRDDLDEPFDHCDISLLSIGTGRPTYALNPPATGAGLAWWAPHLFDVSSLSQSQGVDFQMRYVLGDRYRRIDYDLPEKGWSLDRGDLVDRLTHLGRNRATDTLLELRPLFFSCLAPKYHPFLDAHPAA